MRDYELVVLLHPDLEIDLDKPLKKVADVITSSGGKVVKKDVWGKRKLAYPINKVDFAVYVYFDIQLEPSAVAKVEGLFNITDEVIRYLVTTPVPVDEDEEKEEKETTGDKKDSKEEKKPKTTKPTKDDDKSTKEKE